MSGCWLCISYYLPNPFSLGFSLTGLARGGQQVTKCKEMFVKAIELMIELASLQVREREWANEGRRHNKPCLFFFRHHL